jgi:hypothetical protein
LQGFLLQVEVPEIIVHEAEFLASGQYGRAVDALGMQAGASASRNENPAALTLAEWVMPQFEICGV